VGKTYFLFAGDTQDDGTAHGMYDYVGYVPDLDAAYRQLVHHRKFHNNVNYAHLAEYGTSRADTPMLWIAYELVTVEFEGRDVEAWQEYGGKKLHIIKPE
jgi:hypothetical protein